MRKLTIWGATLFGLVSIVSPAVAEDPPIKPGDGTIDARRIAPYDNAFVVTVYKKGKAGYPGIWTDQVRLRDINGHEVLVRTQSIAYADGRFLSSVNVVDPITFAPISSIQHNNDGSVEAWTFDRTHVEAHITPAAAAIGGETHDGASKERVIKYDTPAPYFDLNCCMRSIVAAMLPPGALKLGYTFVLAANDGGDAPANASYKVIGREMVRAGALGMVDAWVVETPVSGASGGYVRFWIGDQAPYLFRMTLSTNSVNDYAQSFDMLAPGAVPSPQPSPR